ncbi:O-antigen ligase family protein [Micromonospora sp. NPDC049559]|uniref:O-antigen ligase family protein n=1 Tax=Micromonospora sp. NPDC049559 TaxID=3155923 RepID=UPI003412D583
METSTRPGPEATPGDPSTPAGGTTLPAHLALLVVALAAGVVAQGGYYPAGRILVTGLVAVAFAVGWWSRRGPALTSAQLLVAGAAGALAVWILVRAVPAGGYPVALGAAATCGCVAAVVLLLARTGPAEREAVAFAALGLGALVALTAWWGVAGRSPRFAVLVEGRLWRGAATLTYPNAAAALLVPLALLAVALLVARARPVPLAGVGYVLLVGVGAALSRAGVIALLAGLVVLAPLAGVRATLTRAAPPILGAGIAVVALLPSVPGTAQPRTGLAVLGLLAGALVAVGPFLLARHLPAGPGARAGRAVAVATAVALPLLGVAAILATVDGDALRTVLASRGNLASSGRSGAAGAALRLVAAQPVVGTGVGQARFLWLTPDGNGQLARYAHNEYLQVLVDLGAVGFALLLALFTALALTVRRGRAAGHRPGIRAGAIAALAALAVHSGFDFLWHIAVLPLAAGLLVGLAGPAISEEPTIQREKEQQ